MIRYAFERGVKVQIIISFGNEAILNESNFTVSFDGVNIVSFIGKVIDPKTYKTCEEFYQYVCKDFETLYKTTQASFKKININIVKNSKNENKYNK